MDVILAGFCGTGSSAIEDILLEYKDFTVGNYDRFEHVLFYIPDGLFDLEDRLLYNNSLHMFDGAIRRFYSAMKRLNDMDFGWFGGYKNRTNNRFMTIVNEFIEELTEYKIVGYWSDDLSTKRTIKGFVKDVLVYKFSKKSKYGERTIVQKNDDNIISFSFVSKEKFYCCARKFVKKYCDMIKEGNNEKSFIFDQLILPQHICRFGNYFDKNEMKIILVDRDPRDLFVLSKYIWTYQSKRDNKYYPDAIENYIKFHQDMRKTVDYSEKNLLSLKFENLIYNYDESIEKIENFLHIDSSQHISKQQKFKPDISIKNTQNFLINSEWEKEVKIFEKELSEYIFDFPYSISVNIEETTDP